MVLLKANQERRIFWVTESGCSHPQRDSRDRPPDLTEPSGVAQNVLVTEQGWSPGIPAGLAFSESLLGRKHKSSITQPETFTAPTHGRFQYLLNQQWLK